MYAPLPMVPGPVTVPAVVLDALRQDYGSGQIEADFLALYAAAGRSLARIMGTRNQVVVMTGEGMLALWAALKSCLQPGDGVLSLVNGVFGDGIGDMAASLGCRVRKVTLPYNETFGNLDSVEAALREFQPRMITAVHCETPSGTLNPLAGLGELKRRYGVPLLYMDAVSSLGGAPVAMDDWGVDLLLGGSQKCLSAPPSLCFLGVSPAAWERIEEVGYEGYDALAPWRRVQEDGRCPYTPYWHCMAALHAAAVNLLDEGLPAVFARHDAVAAACRRGLENLDMDLWAAPGSVPSPTVTAALVPRGFTWPAWQAALRRRGLVVAGSFGPMAGQVFRLGHMGNQARPRLMEQTLEVLAEALKEGR